MGTRRNGWLAWAIGLLALGAAQAQFGPPQGGPGPGPRRPMPQGPWDGDLKLTVLRHGQPDGEPRLFVQHAGVPSLVRRADGALVAAFQWFPSGEPRSFDRVAVMISPDGGVSWSLPRTIAIADWPENLQRPFDPTLVPLPGGGLRLYFTTGDGPPGPNQATWIGSAVSDDGLEYRFEPGIRWRNPAGARTFDPAVAMHQGEYWLTCPREGGGAYLAWSNDGLSFEAEGTVEDRPEHPWIGNLLGGDTLRFFGGGPDGVWCRALEGETWGQPVLLPAEGGDPAVLELDGGVTLILSVRMRPPEGFLQQGLGGPGGPMPFRPRR